MSRVEKFGRGHNRQPAPSKETNKKADNPTDAEMLHEHPEDGLPARRHIHPSNKQQMTKWFYRLLFVLFISLLIGLLLWGRNYAKF
ncbi:hypothetical protein Back11_23750 [Paenibacillus baekrokdamisoli]|uniref:Uncharacterized protein n=1 Tax=Paenibacillus baekrokdamisoli TaxID=1712516 RepID=A0A3G9IQ85_9BACL|nr:hypothetical protein [Paenibacillus baekrokdamisoli]MBB3069616.1 hypothetical protein [Paenibacillus baekrokdamisoli]BBH21030.1 hypothetical protein Back11_23750 [Paenibacillus baekrokdamisoli]